MTQFWLFTIEELDIGSMYNGENTKSQNTQHVSWTINLFLSLSQRKDIIFRNYFLSIESSVPLKKNRTFKRILTNLVTTPTFFYLISRRPSQSYLTEMSLCVRCLIFLQVIPMGIALPNFIWTANSHFLSSSFFSLLFPLYDYA